MKYTMETHDTEEKKTTAIEKAVVSKESVEDNKPAMKKKTMIQINPQRR